MGKKLGVKDYRDAKVQAAFSDGEAERAIKEGVKDERQGEDETVRGQALRRGHQGSRRLRSFASRNKRLRSAEFAAANPQIRTDPDEVSTAGFCGDLPNNLR